MPFKLYQIRMYLSDICNMHVLRLYGNYKCRQKNHIKTHFLADLWKKYYGNYMLGHHIENMYYWQFKKPIFSIILCISIRSSKYIYLIWLFSRTVLETYVYCPHGKVYINISKPTSTHWTSYDIIQCIRIAYKVSPFTIFLHFTVCTYFKTSVTI